MSTADVSQSPVRLMIVAHVGDDGAVLGFEPGAGIDGALVEVSPLVDSRTMLSGTTDASGLAVIELPGPGTYRVSLTHNVDGGALLADAEIHVEAPDHDLHLAARAFPTPE